MAIPPEDQMVCRLCGEPCAANSYCYGCKSYICDDHATVMGSHEPEDHDAAVDE